METLTLEKRSYKVHLPPHLDLQKKYPAVIFFHGMGGTAEHAAANYGWVEKANKEHFIAVFPEALTLDPNKPGNFVSNPTAWAYTPSSREIDEIGFTEKMLKEICEKFPIDRDKIFLTGFSSGACMACEVAVKLSKQIAAIGIVSGHLLIDFKPEKPLSFMLIIGMLDKVNPPAGGSGRETPWTSKPEYKHPLQKTIDKWVEYSGANKIPKEEIKGFVKTYHYAPGPERQEVYYILVEGQGHEWPGGTRVMPEELSGPQTSYNATDVLWDFFSHHFL